MLPYWYQAAHERGVTRGVAVVHFDTHDDLSLPHAGSLRQPTELGDVGTDLGGWSSRDGGWQSDLNRHVARNDVFILDAAMTGLVDRVLFIGQQRAAAKEKKNG